MHRMPAVVATRILSSIAFSVCVVSCYVPSIAAQETVTTSSAESVCLSSACFFENEVWARVGERTCVRCHNKDGEAADSAFILRRLDDTGGNAQETQDWLSQNRAAFEAMAKERKEEESRLILKATGHLDHGGGEVLKADSTGLEILKSFVRRMESPSTETTGAVVQTEPVPFFEGAMMAPPSRLWRRLTLSLCGRLPTPEELSRTEHMESDDADALNGLMDELMNEQAFYDRLKEGFNDIFLTVGIEDNAETLLSYHHFEKTRLWYQTHDFSHLPEEERERAGWKLADVYRDALLQEPLRMIEYIVRNDRPFTELVTADYLMVSPYTARGYGIIDSIRDQFKNPEDPFEYIPARLPALTGRDGIVQESPTGQYPHAGFLSMFHYLRRYPSTETNRNRLRARCFTSTSLASTLCSSPRVRRMRRPLLRSMRSPRCRLLTVSSATGRSTRSPAFFRTLILKDM
jgi:hypothetical protein